MIDKYFKRHFHFNQIFQGEGEDPEVAAPPRKKISRNFKIFVQVLRLLPYLCVAGFVTSFFWDFSEQHTVEIFGSSLSMESLLRVVSVSGLIGFSTNWLAIKMLFKPVYRRPVWGQGLIPAQKDRIVWQLAGGIHTHILSEDLIRDRIEESGLIKRVNGIILKGVRELLNDEEFRSEVKELVRFHLNENLSREELRERFFRLIDQKLEENLQTGLKGIVFRTYRNVNKAEYEAMIGKVLDSVPATVVELIEELEGQTEVLIDLLNEKEEDMEIFFFRLIRDVLDRIDIRTLLSRQMAHFDEAKLEQMIWRATNQQLLYIQYLGTLLGILGGLLIWQPLAVVVLYGTILLTLWGADVALHNTKQKPAPNVESGDQK